jgi:hypothetical protein
MPHLNLLNYFNAYFSNFCKKQKIENNPSFGICYKGKNSEILKIIQNNSKNLTPIVHKISSEDEDVNDLKFISHLDDNLRKYLGFERFGKYSFETGFITLPSNTINKEELQTQETPNLIYILGGISSKSYNDSPEKTKEKNILETKVASIVLWSLKNQKEPLQINFNYNLQESENKILRILGKESLERFISKYDFSSF